MENYDILEWVDYFEKSRGKVDPKTDFLESDSRVLYPGRFYVLNYAAKTRDRFNARPVIISLGVSKKEPDSFLCIDLSVIPKRARLKFIEMYFRLYRNEIWKEIETHTSVDDADKQTWMRDFSYENICRAVPMIPLKHAIKRYKIQNTRKIYSLPFSGVYKVVGDYCDEDCYVNGTVREVQQEFLRKMSR